MASLTALIVLILSTGVAAQTTYTTWSRCSCAITIKLDINQTSTFVACEISTASHVDPDPNYVCSCNGATVACTAAGLSNTTITAVDTTACDSFVTQTANPNPVCLSTGSNPSAICGGQSGVATGVTSTAKSTRTDRQTGAVVQYSCTSSVNRTRCTVSAPCGTTDCEVSAWTPGTCSVTCGTGVQIDTRRILTQPSGGGVPCPELNRTVTCIQPACQSPTPTPEPEPEPEPEPAPGPSVNCQVGAWGGWSACSRTCGRGVQQRTRAIVVAPSGVGTPCPALYETRVCTNIAECSVGFLPPPVLEVLNTTSTVPRVTLRVVPAEPYTVMEIMVGNWSVVRLNTSSGVTPLTVIFDARQTINVTKLNNPVVVAVTYLSSTPVYGLQSMRVRAVDDEGNEAFSESALVFITPPESTTPDGTSSSSSSVDWNIIGPVVGVGSALVVTAASVAVWMRYRVSPSYGSIQ